MISVVLWSALSLGFAPRAIPPPAISARAAVAMRAPAKTAEGLPSFVGTEMRAAAMKLHTFDQAPKEGQQPAQAPVSTWEPGKAEYLQFLADSRHVYSCFDRIVAEAPVFESFRASGLERAGPLAKDIAWFEAEGMPAPAVAAPGTNYVALLEGMAAAGEHEKLVCHFYNFYFAHTAGGLQIGKMMSDKLLGGRTLDFYKWDGDVKGELLPALRGKIDAMAAGWDREQKDACCSQTAAAFKFGGGLLKHLRAPAA